jgi:hypothetical protein
MTSSLDLALASQQDQMSFQVFKLACTSALPCSQSAESSTRTQIADASSLLAFNSNISKYRRALQFLLGQPELFVRSKL